ncbi:uncharacterized protein LOC144142445 isoform X2 [Haemaphysalis longicornis]
MDGQGYDEAFPWQGFAAEDMILSSSELPQSEDGEFSSPEDSYEGEGTREEVPARVDKAALNSSVSEALQRLVELCDAPDSGVVSLDKLMEVIESRGFECSNQDVHSLTQVYNALCVESESKGLVTNGAAGKRDFHVDIHGSRVIRDLLDHYRNNAHLDGIWEPALPVLLDSSKSDVAASAVHHPAALPGHHGGGGDSNHTGGVGGGGGCLPAPSGRSSPSAASSSSSSAGILSTMEMSMFSYGSKEGIAGELSFLDVAESESERAQLQHTVQRLTKEKEDTARQLTQLEEANQSLVATNRGLLERIRSLSQEVEALKCTSEELEDTKAALVATTDACRLAEQQLQHAKAAKAALQVELERRIADMDSLQEKVAKLEMNEERAAQKLAKNREQLRTLERRNLTLEENLSLESSKLHESTATIQDLSRAVEALEQKRKDAEDELRQQQDENCRLKEVLYERSLFLDDNCDSTLSNGVGNNTGSAVGTVTAEANLESDEGVFDRCISPAGSLFLNPSETQPISDELFFSALDLPCTSTPLHTAVRGSGRRQLPICGIPRMPSWDCSMIVRRHSECGPLHPISPTQAGPSSLPARITSVAQVDVAFESNGAEASPQTIRGDEKEQAEQVIRALEEEIAEHREERAVLERRRAELRRFLALVWALLRKVRCSLHVLNDEAVRALESHTGAASILALAHHDRQLVSALEDISPESAYSFPEEVVREQIQLELQTLRAQITKSQAVLTYLQSRGYKAPLRPSSECATLERKALVPHRGYSEEGVHPSDRHYDTVETSAPRRLSTCNACGCVGRCRGRHGKARLSSTLSCPTLPSRDSPVARGTQTDPAATTKSRDSQTDAAPLAADHLQRGDSEASGRDAEFDVWTTAPGEMSPPFPRQRSNSFVCAIEEGSRRLAEASDDCQPVQAAQSLPVSSSPAAPTDDRSAKPQVPRLLFEDFDAERRVPDAQTRKAAFRRCLLGVGRSVAMDLDQPDASSTGTPQQRAPLKKTSFMLERPETESAQGSLDGQEAFPSFSDIVLATQGLSKDSPGSDQLTEEEIENKFTTLSLGFKTDRLTLNKRLELHQRHRDIAEGNIQDELKAIRDLAKTLDSLYTDDERVREVVAKIRSHVDVIQQSTDRVSSQAEVYGAVQQEERMSRAFEVMVAHVENLKRASEREHRELEEARKLLLDHQLHDVASATPAKDSRGRLFSIPAGGSLSGSASGPVRAVRALNLGVRRCSLPVPQAVHLPAAAAAAAAAHDTDAAGGKQECHIEEDTPGTFSKSDVHNHSARDGADGIGVANGVSLDHSSLGTDESLTLQNGTVLDELVAAASIQNALDSPDHLDGVEEMDPSELQAQEEEEEDGHHGGEGETGGRNGATNPVSIDLLHWAATVVIRMKYWLNNSRRVLAGRRRLAPVTVERFTTARYFVGGLLMAAALVTVLVVLFPGASSSAAQNGYDLMALWRDMCNNPPEFITVRRNSLPPPI